MLADALLHPPADILPLQLVAVDAGDDADAPSVAAVRRLQAVLFDAEPLVHGQADLRDNLDHFRSLLISVLPSGDCASQTRTVLSLTCDAPPKNTPRLTGQSPASRPTDTRMYSSLTAR